MWRLGQRLEWCSHNNKKVSSHQHPEEGMSLEFSEEVQHFQHFDFRLLASRTLRECPSVVFSHQICGIYSGSPRKLHTTQGTLWSVRPCRFCQYSPSQPWKYYSSSPFFRKLRQSHSLRELNKHYNTSARRFPSPDKSSVSSGMGTSSM